MAGQLGNEQPPPGQQQRREPEPVRRRAAEPVDEHQRLTAAAGQVAQPRAAQLGMAFLEIRQLRLCVRHAGRLLFEAMDRSGRQDP